MDRARINRRCGNRRGATYLEGAQALVEELEWTDDVDAVLWHPSACRLLDWMRGQCRVGIAQLFRFTDYDDCLYLVTRVDRDPTEWVICWARGTGTAKFGPIVVELGRQRQMPLRVHIDVDQLSRARLRLFGRYGFELSEYMLRCTHNGRRGERQGHQPESEQLKLYEPHVDDDRQQHPDIRLRRDPGRR